MLRSLRSIVLILLTTACLSGFASATVYPTVTIQGNEQQSANGVWDSGTVTITINGHSQSVVFGQFSTPASIASGLAAKLSSDCAGTVNAKATGAVIAFNLRHTASSLGAVTVSTTHDTADFASTSFSVNSGSWPTTTIMALSASPATPSLAGASVTFIELVPFVWTDFAFT
jgi:hypothetical protein